MPGAHYGDFPTSHTAVCMVFDSFTASTGASSATSNFAAGDVQIYKDGGVTQRSSSAGIVVSTSFDSNTGLQMVTIDLSDNTDAGFYAAGHEYSVAVADVTIDSQTVRFWLGSFSIERAGGVLALLKAGTAKVDVTKWLTGTIPAVNVTGVPLVDLKYTLGTISPATAGTVRAEMSSTERNNMADAILDRDMAAGADNGSTTVRTIRQALRFLRNKWSISGTTLTVTKEDDATTSWTSQITTSASADPVTANDPAGP